MLNRPSRKPVNDRISERCYRAMTFARTGKLMGPSRSRCMGIVDGVLTAHSATISALLKRRVIELTEDNVTYRLTPRGQRSLDMNRWS